MKPFHELSKEEQGLLLYFEACMCDHACTVDLRNMNDDDRAIAKEWHNDGAIIFGRRPWQEGLKRTHFVILGPETLRLAHEARTARIGRILKTFVPSLEENRVGLYDEFVAGFESVMRGN